MTLDANQAAMLRKRLGLSANLPALAIIGSVGGPKEKSVVAGGDCCSPTMILMRLF